MANTYPMDVETAVSAGRAIAHHVKSTDGDKKYVVIGQDTRLSGDMIAQAVSAGICSAGLDVSFLGVLPTPVVAFIAARCEAAAGVVISASHNPFYDNGIKVFDAHGYKLSDEAESRIETLMEKGAADTSLNADPHEMGQCRTIQNPGQRYIDFLIQSFPHLNLSGRTIVLDCANGATSAVAPELFQRLGARVIPLFCEPNGTNINEHCGSQHPQAMAASVVDNRADLGLAFDGDGDRLIAVDEKGTVLTGDQVMAVCARDLASKDLLKNRAVVCTVMSNMGFHQAMKKLGLTVHTTQVGDRYVMQEMLARGAVLGGEDSGHLIFRDKHTTGDGMLAAIRLLDAVQSASRPLSDLARVMTVFPQVLINVDVRSKPGLNSLPEIGRVIDSVQQQLGEQGRVLVRYSGTQPQCRVMVEGPALEQTRDCCRQIADVVRKTLG